MPFTSEQLAYAGKAALDYFLKNSPTDQYNVDRPLINKLMGTKQEYAGAALNVVEQLRFTNDSNFQSYFGSGQVSFNRKRTLTQAKFTWGSFHDGFGLDEDELVANGITVVDDKQATASQAEKIQLTNLLQENMDTLKLGFEENFDVMLHRNGTQSTTDIAGLDLLVSTTPSVGTVGGIDASVAANAFWRNYALTGIAAGSIIPQMEIAWRAAIRVGGKAPDYILVGSAFADNYRTQAATAGNGGVTRQVVVGSGSGVKTGTTLDASVGTGVSTGLYFKGIELIWDPVFDNLQVLDAPATDWTKRCYFLNTKYLKLRPIKGHWQVARRPPRVYDRYVHYWAITSKAALTTGKRNAHAVLALA